VTVEQTFRKTNYNWLW